MAVIGSDIARLPFDTTDLPGQRDYDESLLACCGAMTYDAILPRWLPPARRGDRLKPHRREHDNAQQ
jgi:hypothetical protein